MHITCNIPDSTIVQYKPNTGQLPHTAFELSRSCIVLSHYGFRLWGRRILEVFYTLYQLLLEEIEHSVYP